MPPLSSLSFKVPFYFGIDPGEKGGVVGVSARSDVMQWKMPASREQVIALFRELTGKYTCYAVIESVHSMPGNSARGMFTFGQGFGVLLTCLDVFRWNYTLKSPQAWQKQMGVRKRGKDEKKNAWKGRLVRLARAKIDADFTQSTADAALLALCAREDYSETL